MIETIKKDLINRYLHHVDRLNHVYGVKNTAMKLGKIHRVDLEKIECVAYLHDLTKYESPEFHREWILKIFNEQILLEYYPPLWHAFSAVAIAKLKYGITDIDMLNAIESHTVGKPSMSMLEKIIFISDYIEPNRLYPHCVEVRELAFQDIDLAIFKAIDYSIRYYENTQSTIPNTAYEAHKYYINGGNHAKN